MSDPAHPKRSAAAEAGVRQARMRTSGASLERLPGGVLLIRPDEALRPYPKVLTDSLIHWARLTPEKTCIAKRGPDGEWRQLTYAQVARSVQSVGQALLDRGLSVERPVAILSENDLEQYVLTMAGQHVGIPTAPLSPAYSLVSKDFAKLRHAFKILTPGCYSFPTASATRRPSKPWPAITWRSSRPPRLRTAAKPARLPICWKRIRRRRYFARTRKFNPTTSQNSCLPPDQRPCPRRSSIRTA